MLFAQLATLALPIIGVTAAPLLSEREAVPASVQKRGDVLDIVTALQTKISDSVTQINALALNGSDIASADDLTVYLTNIGNDLDVANVAIGSVLRKRQLLPLASEPDIFIKRQIIGKRQLLPLNAEPDIFIQRQMTGKRELSRIDDDTEIEARQIIGKRQLLPLDAEPDAFSKRQTIDKREVPALEHERRCFGSTCPPPNDPWNRRDEVKAERRCFGSSCPPPNDLWNSRDNAKPERRCFGRDCKETKSPSGRGVAPLLELEHSEKRQIIGKRGDAEPLADIDIFIRQAADEDVEEVAAVLASIIADIFGALDNISDDLASLPAIGALIGSINGGLSTVLLGVEVVLAGVIQLVDGLLTGLGLGGLLAGLGLGGLLGGILA